MRFTEEFVLINSAHADTDCSDEIGFLRVCSDITPHLLSIVLSTGIISLRTQVVEIR